MDQTFTADVSKATATRDLQYLLEIKALIQTGGGRSIREC
jgi:Fic family protein